MAISGGAGAPAVLTVYSRAACHLCDEMIAGLNALQARLAFTFEVVDIDGDPVLVERYGEDVPVLASGAREICRHRLDPARVESWLSRGPGIPAGLGSPGIFR